MGNWYEIARLPNHFEEGLSRVTAHYRLMDNGRVHIFNKGYTADGEESSVSGEGYIPNKMNGGHLRISFVYPYRWFYSDYNILYVDDRYSIALVSGSNNEYLWLLARQPEVNDEEQELLINHAKKRGFKLDKLIWNHQRHR